MKAPSLTTLGCVMALAACAGKATPVTTPPVPSARPDALTMPSPAEYDDRPISAEAGAAYFLRSGGGDPYATGMAYPVFLALMEAYPDVLGRDWNEFADKFGFLQDPAANGDPRAVPIGFHLTIDPNTSVPWVVSNCQMCHAERLHLETGDIVVAGLGNKRVRAHAYASALFRIGTDPKLDDAEVGRLATKRAADWSIAWTPQMRAPIVKNTLAGLRALATKRAARTAKLAAALPGRMATAESFAIAMDDYGDAPVPLPETTGWARVPDVVGFPFRETSSFDASGYGSPQALVVEANFLFGARPAWYLSHPHIATSMYLYLRSFRRKLAYPKPIDVPLAARGKEAFYTRCSGCHGVYVEQGGQMRVSYVERVVPIGVVGTDAAREEAITPAFVDAANALELSRGYTRVRNTGGYVPPVLLDVWARGLFGHVGQWPSLEVLAMPPEDRPKRFVVDTSGLYDLERVGVRYEAGSAPRALRAGEYLYDGGAPGYGVEGHPFLSKLTKDDRQAVIEYLKTL